MRWTTSDVGSNSASIIGRGMENGSGPRLGEPRATHGNGSESSGGSDHEVGLIVGGVGGLAEPLAIAFAGRGMDVAIVFVQRRATLAESIKRRVEQAGRRCLLIPNQESERVAPHIFARRAIEDILREFGRLDVFVSLSGKLLARDQPDGDRRDPSKLLSSIIPNVAVMKAAMNEIVR